ncbi:Outer membrane lipoprotein Omp16 precursor [Roseivivax jejudonensis]|uniref:Outer membrane lipoprotein Omp16 n=1 Tax=Roseivivax jejudonensis TaxID=1529041 RepID=A0A1X7A7F5_9RHOB|nr:OmpA family protein [Roseivivax jejudonensis]SLN72417.1 Outer membrane lipoprotein Omp16 precursor [Roseivivax jejudonensis]
MRAFLLSTAGLLALSACGDAGRDPVFTQFHRESGAVIDTGAFGTATKSNLARMKGQSDYAYDLQQRFAAEVPTTVNFAFNSASLGAAARSALLQQANFIRQFPEIHFRVYGHTDLVGSDAYNKALGLRRAQAVVAFLGQQGISLSRLEAVVSYGETQPLVVTEGRERRNRRTVTEVSGFVKGHPSVLDGKYAEIIYRDYVQSAQPTSTLSGGGVGQIGGGGGGDG